MSVKEIDFLHKYLHFLMNEFQWISEVVYAQIIIFLILSMTSRWSKTDDDVHNFPRKVSIDFSQIRGSRIKKRRKRKWPSEPKRLQTNLCQPQVHCLTFRLQQRLPKEYEGKSVSGRNQSFTINTPVVAMAQCKNHRLQIWRLPVQNHIF